MCDTKYQGWTNRATWSVSLWLSNEYNIYSHFQDCVEDLANSVFHLRMVRNGLWTENQAIVFALASEIEEYVKDQNPLAKAASMYSDILSHAIAGVNWEEVAKSFIEK